MKSVRLQFHESVLTYKMAKVYEAVANVEWLAGAQDGYFYANYEASEADAYILRAFPGEKFYGTEGKYKWSVSEKGSRGWQYWEDGGTADSMELAKKAAETSLSNHLTGGKDEAFDRKAIVTTAADVFKTIGNTGKIAFKDLMKKAKEKGYHVGADTDDKVRAFAKELANELSATKDVVIEGDDSDYWHPDDDEESDEEKKAKCPKCGEDIWDYAKGSKLNKCWNCMLAFDSEQDEGMNDIGDTPKLHLQGIGKVAARPASSIRPGDILLFNYGYPSKVLTADQEGKWVVFKLQYIRDNDGKEYSMKKKLDTMVGVQDSSPDDRHVQPTEAKGDDLLVKEVVAGFMDNFADYARESELTDPLIIDMVWLQATQEGSWGEEVARRFKDGDRKFVDAVSKAILAAYHGKSESSRYHVMQDENDGKFYVVATVSAKTVSSGYKSRKDAEAHMRDLDKSEGMGADLDTYVCPDCGKNTVHANSSGWRDCEKCGWKETKPTNLAKAKKTEKIDKQVKCPTCGAAAINVGQAPEGKFGRTVYKCSKCVGSWDIANTKPTSWKDQYKDEAGKVYPVQRGQGASDESYANYGWMIDRDLIADPAVKAPSNSNAVGMVGPRDISPEILARLKAGEGQEFRMRDGDQEVYYYGRLIIADEDAGGEDDFAPLEDFGTPNAGAAEIQYKQNGVWATL